MSHNEVLFSKNTFGGLAIGRQEMNDRAGRKSDIAFNEAGEEEPDFRFQVKCECGMSAGLQLMKKLHNLCISSVP